MTNLAELTDETRAEYLQTHEVARQLGLKQGTVRRAFRDGLLDGRVFEPRAGWRILLITPASVETYRAQHLGRRGRRFKDESAANPKRTSTPRRKQATRLVGTRRGSASPAALEAVISDEEGTPDRR